MGILEALEMAQRRNKERDVMNAQRNMPVLPIIPTNEIKPITLDSGGSDGNGFQAKDTRTPEQRYRDAINMNKYVGSVPVVGPALSLLNDYEIREYERENPDKIASGPRYSILGRIMGFGDAGTTGVGGVFGENSDLWNRGMFPIDGDSGNDSTSNVGYRGDAYRAESGGGMGPSHSGPSYGGADAGTGDDDQWD